MKNDSLQSPRVVAPGMDVSFILKFVPEEKKDYSYNIVCVTEREKFLVPVQAIGARGKELGGTLFHLLCLKST
jgi:hydrocephalus-inducing protein